MTRLTNVGAYKMARSFQLNIVCTSPLCDAIKVLKKTLALDGRVACLKVLPTGLKALPAGSEALPTGSEVKRKQKIV